MFENEKIKNIGEKIISLIPYSLLLILLISLGIVIYKYNLTFDRLIEILKIIIWPIIVLSALLFFRKVFTYLFFSMEEFNFFGTKGKLKDIREVIEEKVKIKFDESENEKLRGLEIKKITEDFEKMKLSKDSTDKKMEEWAELSKYIFNKYKEVSDLNVETKKELDSLRKEKLEKENRLIDSREKIEQNTVIKSSNNNNLNKDTDIPKAEKMPETKKDKVISS